VTKTEVELRSFISDDEYLRLIQFFQKNATPRGEQDEVTYYFGGEKDLRIQKNTNYSKVWLKGGKMHEGARKELEVRFKTEDFDEMLDLFREIGYKIKLGWKRRRKMFIYTYEGMEIFVCIDDTKNYGKIIELEIESDVCDKEKCLKVLKKLFREIKIEPTPKEIFEKKFQEYQNCWNEVQVPEGEDPTDF